MAVSGDKKVNIWADSQHRNASVLSPKVHQNPRKGDRHVTHFQEEKFAKKKIWVSAELSS